MSLSGLFLWSIVLFIVIVIVIGIPIIILIKSLKTSKNENESTSTIATPLQNNSKKFCSSCGNQLHIDAVVCPNCGCAVSLNLSNTQMFDKNSTGLNILSYIFPLLGFILYLILEDDKPIKAKGCKKFAILGFVIPIIVIAILLVFLFLFSKLRQFVLYT